MTDNSVRSFPPQTPPPQQQLPAPKLTGGWKRRFLPFNLLMLSAFLVLVAANTQSGWVMVIASLLAAVVLQAWLASFSALKGLEVTRQTPPSAVAGEPCRVTLTVRNASPRSKYLVHLIEHLPNTLADVCPQRRFLINQLPPQGTVTVSYEVNSPTRGTHRFDLAELECGFPFGLCSSRRRLSLEPTLLRLCPQTIPGTSLPRSRSAELQPCHSLPTKGQSDDFYGLRTYVYGDTLRQVHWPASAHAGELQVREMQAESAPQRLIIALDTTRGVPLLTERQEDMESALRLVASLCAEAQRHGQSVLLGAVCQGQIVTAEFREHADFLAALQAELDPAGSDRLQQWLVDQRAENCQLVYIAVPGITKPKLATLALPEEVWRAEIGPGCSSPTLYLEFIDSEQARQRRYTPVSSSRVPLTWRRQAQEWEPCLPASFIEGRNAYQSDPADEESTLAWLLEAL